MKFLKDPLAYILLYIAMIPFTFGHAWKSVAGWAPDPGAAAFGASWSAIFWPFYWSVQLWK